MKAEILAIGDELLIGQTINTNASWLGMELSLRGISVVRSLAIQDSKEAILKAMDDALKTVDLVIVTGGLGPTKDDITKHTLCEYFDTELEINQEVLNRVEDFFTKRGRIMLEVNRQQAALPKSCEVLQNLQGTASGMWFEKHGKVLISLPGVPYEMKGIMNQFGWDKIQSFFQVESIYHQTVSLQGIGESFLADRMKNWEDAIRSEGLGLAYLPSVGNLKLRITSSHGEQDAEKINRYFSVLKETLPQYVYGEGAQTLTEVVGNLLKQNQKTIGTVESCTGGLLAHEIVKVSGASSYFQGSFLTYSNELKHKLVDVSIQNLDEFGVVSKQVVEQMALNGRLKLGVDFCIATSGIAGPDGGSDEIPVGTVWIALAGRGWVESYRFQFGDHRERNMQLSVLTALNLLRCKLLNIKIEKK